MDKCATVVYPQALQEAPALKTAIFDDNDNGVHWNLDMFMRELESRTPGCSVLVC